MHDARVKSMFKKNSKKSIRLKSLSDHQYGKCHEQPHGPKIVERLFWEMKFHPRRSVLETVYKYEGRRD